MVARFGTVTGTRVALALALALVLLGGAAGCAGQPPSTQAPGRHPTQSAESGQNRSGTTADRPATTGFTLVATGDILPHDSVIEQARRDAGGRGHDFRRMLSGAAPAIAGADLAICHMETVFGAADGPFSGYPTFLTPPQIAQAVRDTGYHSCSTASNHTLDAGRAGVVRTLDAMDAAGLRHVGSARSATERARPPILRAGDARVAHLAYTYGSNVSPGTDPVRMAKPKSWLVNLIDPDRIIADARAARRSGADVVVVSTHWGTEWQEEPDEDQLRLADQLTASRFHGRRDIDLIIGTHAHVPQAYEKVNGTWVVYGMGDQLVGEMSDPRGAMGSAARFAFAPPKRPGGAWRVTRAEYVPHLVVNRPRVDIVNLARGRGRADEPGEYRRARELISRAVLSRGAADDGLVMGR
ncbi:CapA family protein [Streptomyces alkaliterrae]|uniref:CapA family protein n=1 Tax=Streptomyces alkaliterrae TaxID=2213162 RepID=A0A5P0YRJ6_9ACTN|nr:CapA family protein [Streptomyces alkaliterrae]MBB1254913.1 CapA family protein [Streptomyces alkaliterrae]MBB1259159.1 CapA family protein [Streptomyces alkaliterrae]MQS02062.1 CapA family protein [Streptomyces alkaliterrae]